MLLRNILLRKECPLSAVATESEHPCSPIKEILIEIKSTVRKVYFKIKWEESFRKLTKNKFNPGLKFNLRIKIISLKLMSANFFQFSVLYCFLDMRFMRCYKFYVLTF